MVKMARLRARLFVPFLLLLGLTACSGNAEEVSTSMSAEQSDENSSQHNDSSTAVEEYETYESYEMEIGSGDKLELELITNDGWTISDQNSELGGFIIKHNNHLVADGGFYSTSKYQELIDQVYSDEKVEKLSLGVTDGHEWQLWKYPNGTYYYSILVKGEKTLILMKSQASEDEIRECFARLTIRVLN
ncbi:MAG: hypothetical protein Q4B91_02265 [Atopobiaceae bacterium]|nr:hypothetical protein [Atopobiaceae bacterium]